MDKQEVRVPESRDNAAKGIEIRFADSPNAPKAATEKFIMAMYGKTLVEFAREIERGDSQTEQTEQKSEED
jgi:hypothetical protein